MHRPLPALPPAKRGMSHNGEESVPRDYIVKKLLQRYWRLTRALTLGAQGAIVDPEGRVLLVRHTYQPGWRFPGGGVEKGETVAAALSRELEEEVGVTVTGEPQLFGIYANAASFPNDHIVLFVVRSWRQERVPDPNYEIAEQRFFTPGDVPGDISAGTGRRLAEIFASAPRSAFW